MSPLTTTTTVVSGDQALTDFRKRLAGPALLQHLQAAGGRLLVQLHVGVGKSHALNDLVTAALAAGDHDLVLILAPRKDILHEIYRKLKTDKKLPKGVKPLVLKPRPSALCGNLDPQWQKLERANCGPLARDALCAGCLNRMKCSWLRQYGKQLRGARLILATQQHLTNNPVFVSQLQTAAGAKRPLVLLDESDFLLKRVERIITRDQLDRFVRAQEEVTTNAGSSPAEAQKWLELCQLLRRGKTDDLRGPDWSFPPVRPAWSLAVQKAGRAAFGDTFLFLANSLEQFAGSDMAGRERLGDGAIRFTALPSLGREFVIFSGSMAQELARYRLDPSHALRPLQTPFTGYTFRHPDTHWYNLRMAAGARTYFPGNANVVLDFFAALVARNLKAGKRTLLVASKAFAPRCVRGMAERLNAILPDPACQNQVVTGNWSRNLKNPRAVPLITYGISGVNRFEEFDAAYCLTGYYVPEQVIAEATLEIEPTTDRFPLKVLTDGAPPRRRVTVATPGGLETVLDAVATGVLEQKEGDVIVQAVGRVRPFTKPREVITFHLGELPGVRYNREFFTLDAARQFFGVSTPARVARLGNRARAIELRATGMTLAEVAKKLAVSLATVKRLLKT